MEFGVVRISTKRQNIKRQVRNIEVRYPYAKIIKETYTGTKLEGRKEFENLLKVLKQGDTLIFDSVSRMSRNAEEGCRLYEKLFNDNVNIVFLKEPHINTEVYKKSLESQIQIRLETADQATNDLINSIIEALNKYTIELAKKQIKIAFEQAEKEVKDLQQRTSEGLITAKMEGKQIGQKKGAKLITKKSKEVKALIIKYSKDFDGVLSDKECLKIIKVGKNTFYDYKRELKESA